MRKHFYSWIFKKLYHRILNIEQKYFREGNMETSNDCIRLQNLLNYFKEEIIGE